MENFTPEFFLKSVLNTDGYDKDAYAELRKKSKVLQETEAKGSEQFAAFPHLLGDTWAGLFKNSPEIQLEVPKGVEVNKAIMAEVLNHPEFQAMREYTRLDELASALGSVQLSKKLNEIIQNTGANELQNQANEAQERADAEKRLAEELNELAELVTTDEGKKQEILSQAQKKLQAAEQAQNEAEQLAQQAIDTIQGELKSQTGQEKLAQAIVQATSQTVKDKKELDTMLLSMGYGQRPGERKNVPAKDRLELAEAMREIPKLKIIASYLGRMQKTALKKQRSKSENIAKSNVELGNDIADILPSELALLKNPHGRKLFMKKFVQRELLQYSPKSKDKLGKGPIVCCLDTSGSMNNLDEQAKAFMLALLMIAKRQKRAFACINYASKDQVKSWVFAHSQKIKTKDIIEMAEFFWNGGTNFEAPLNAAVKIIKETERFKKGDIIFITDGKCQISQFWLSEFLEEKNKLQFSVLSIKIGFGNNQVLESFSDKTVNAIDFFDNNASEAFAV